MHSADKSRQLQVIMCVVAATSKDAVDLGYRTAVIDDACRGVTHDGIATAKRELQETGAIILQSDEVRIVDWHLDMI